MSSDPLLEANRSQGEAADPANSVFVTANAGSGKTKVLVDRIARLLLQGSKPSAFLCITYTKAAAAEMQRRLFERLGAWCVADDDTLRKDLTKLGEPHADLGQARALFAQALETPGGLKIQTIHAFCERLLARFPIEAGVPPGFDIADDPRAAELLRRARRDAALAEDGPQDAFRRFAGKLYSEALEGLLDRLALRRADFQRFAEVHGGAEGAAAAIKHRHGARTDSAAFARAFVARQDWERLREAAAKLREGSPNDQKAGTALRAAIDAAERGDDAGAVEAAIAFACKDDGELKASFVTKGTQKLHPWLAPFVERFAEACAQARLQWKAIGRAEDGCAILQLALRLDQSYVQAKDSSGVLDFDDLIAHAQKLLKSSEAAPWVLYKLDGGLDHILIDEGQDTSPTQWDLIAPLQDEFFAGEGGRDKVRTVFAVGDPKQSIYGFQGADPERFLNEARELEARALQAGVVFKGPTLETSFRSTPEVLRAVDATFKGRPLVAANPGKQDEIRHLAARAGEAGVVEVWPLAMRAEPPEVQPWDAPVDNDTGASVHAQLALNIAKRVEAMIAQREAVWDKGALRPMHAGDVLALVRTRGALFRELIKAFKRSKLAVAGADQMILRDELAVEDCLALMRVALDPADDLALACVLKGPWLDFDIDDVDLFPLAHGRKKGETLYARLMESRVPKYERAQGFVADLIQRAGADAFSFLSWALETPHFGEATGWERVFSRLGAETRDPLQELLQRALKPHAYAAPTLQRFLADIENDEGAVKRELEAGGQAIRVMTVHGAKGLEAPVVILPDCTGAVKDRLDDNLIIDEAGPYFSQRTSDDDNIGTAARLAYKERMLGEHWRLLYVAMTRARDRLIVCGAQHGSGKNGEADQSWRLAVDKALEKLGAEPCETPFGPGKRLGALQYAEAKPSAQATAKALPAWAKTLAPGAAPVRLATPSRAGHVDPVLFSPRGQGQKRFRRGVMIHALLERLPEMTVERREAAALAWLRRQGVDDAEGALYVAEALKVIEHPQFAPLFAAGSRAEQPIIGAWQGRQVRGVVDRLAIDAKRVLILDFKTDRPAPESAEATPDAYVVQLALYRQVLREIFPDRRIGCALLWTESPRLMELPDARLDAALERLGRG